MKKESSLVEIPVYTDLIIKLPNSDEKIPKWKKTLKDLIREAMAELEIPEEEGNWTAVRIRRHGEIVLTYF
ncbi:hypothetical protein TNCV_3438251 [Trichonephila clavipes]|nr:hypothetical protein TNCV_3438251 [Trichonephila clavipes]